MQYYTRRAKCLMLNILDSTSSVRRTDQPKFPTTITIIFFSLCIQWVPGDSGEDLLSCCGQQVWSRTWCLSREDRDETSEHGTDYEDTDQVIRLVKVEDDHNSSDDWPLFKYSDLIEAENYWGWLRGWTKFKLFPLHHKLFRRFM